MLQKQTGGTRVLSTHSNETRGFAAWELPKGAAVGGEEDEAAEADIEISL